MESEIEVNGLFQLLRNIETSRKTFCRLKRGRKTAMRRILADILILENFIQTHPDIFAILKTELIPELKHIELRRVLLTRLMLNPFTFKRMLSDSDIDRLVKFQPSREEYESVAQNRLITFDLAV